MRPFIAILLAATSAAAAPIFDGKTLTGWTGATSNYFVKDGLLVCKPEGRHIYTEKQYSDFRLTFEFNLAPGANSGIGLRTPLEGDPVEVAMEVQILDDYAEKWANLSKWQYHGSLYGIQPAKRGHLKPPGEWNHEVITLVGNHLEVVLNGHTINSVRLDEVKPIDGKEHPGLRNVTGHIGILGHGDFASYRNLDVIDLSLSSTEGFAPLFNGKNLDGWKSKDRDAHWSVHSGEIRFDGKGKNLATKKNYTNFDLHLEYKIPPGGDSGIFLRGTPQVQIWDPENTRSHAAGSDKGSGALWNNRNAGNIPLEKADNPAGEWNHLQIRMLGGKTTVFLNSKLVVDNIPLEPYWKKDKPLPEAGSIELQAHGTPLTFRNLQIREL